METKGKTTVSIYFSGGYPLLDLYFSGWISGFCSVSFTGTHAKEWEKKWRAFRETKLQEAKQKFEADKEEKIKKLENELMVSIDSLFRKVRKPLKEKLEQERKRVFNLSEWAELYWIYEFLPNDCVRISTGGTTTIYEIISKPPLKEKNK